MDADTKLLKKRLQEAGLSDPVIDAVWPSWWSEEALSSPSARAELRFSIARKLGLSPSSLFHDEVAFVWKDEARFKHLSNETESQKAALTSFGIAVCRMLIELVPPCKLQSSLSAIELREFILSSRPFIDLQSLLGICWALGIPVVHLRIFPLEAKRMSAMAVKVADRHSILLGRDSLFPASLSFVLAHEIGHVLLGHIGTDSAIVDICDSMDAADLDKEEKEADRFALELLVGNSQPDIRTDRSDYTAIELARTALDRGGALRIEPGTLALCLAHEYGNWSTANKAMQYIYQSGKPVWQEVNQIAQKELDFDLMSCDAADFLRKIMGIGNV